MSILGSILILTIYFAVYGVVHSWLAGASVKGWVRKICGSSTDRWYRLAYNIFAVITLLPMLALMAMLPGQTLYIVPSPWHWLMVGGQFLAIVAATISLLQTGIFYFVGLAQLVDKNPTDGTLNLGGFYAWVRHPLYTFSIIFLWLTPAMTTNTLTAFILFTLYFYFGSIYEERRLVAEFGEAYEAYRRQVPRLIPMPGRRYVSLKK
jgi:protein-S-isoprenylcysteine O-methyltransferase Ste14